MKELKRRKGIFPGAGYLLGLIFGLAVMITFSVSLGATFFGIMLGLSFSLSIGIAFECSFAGDKNMPVFQKILLSVSAFLLVLSVLFLLLWEEGYH